MPALKPSLGIARSGAHRSHPRYRGCVGHWLCGESAGPTVYDVSGFGHHGTCTNMTLSTARTMGLTGLTLAFDGTNDYVSCTGAIVSAHILGDITIAARVIRVGTTGNDVLLAKTNGSSLWDYEFGFGEASLFFYTDVGGAFVNSTTGITDGLWHHVAFTRLGTATTFYLDGVADGTGTVSGAFPTATTTLLLGADTTAGGNALNGRMEDLRLYARALSATEMLSLARDPYLEFGQRRRWLFGGAAPPWTGPHAAALAQLGETGGLIGRVYR